ncbi:MAG: hypothetical protein F4W92_08715 [Gammaproteobacteria bacterium]|nr:hypothetical protein [Gammaproteobacteria bacterium]
MTTTSENSPTNLKRTLYIGLTFTVGLALGVFVVLAIQKLGPQNEHTVEDVAQNGVNESTTSRLESDPTIGSGEIGQIQDILNQPSVFDQQKSLYSTLSSATTEDLKDLWIQSQKIVRESHREIVQHGILSKLATVSPAKALGYIDEVSIFQTDALLKSLFSEWSFLNLEEAIEAAIALSRPRRNIALMAILNTRDDLTESKHREIAIQLEHEETFLKMVSDTKALLSLEEPHSSWDTLLTDEVADYLQAESLLKVAEAWREQIGFKVLSNIYSADIDDDQLRQQLIRKIAEEDPLGALNHTRELTDESEKSSLSRTIVRVWARSDALAALLAVSTFEPTSIASALEVQITMVWASIRPNEVIENIDAVTDEHRLDTLESAFAQLASQDPKSALAKVSSVENLVANTSSIVHSIVREWSYTEPREATNWVLENYEREDPHRLTMLDSVLSYLAPVEPEAAFEIALEHSTGGRWGGLELDVFHRITYAGNLELAKKLIPRVHEDSKPFAYIHYGEALVKHAQTEEALELGKNLNEEQQSSYYRQVMSVWARESAKNLYEQLDDLPTDELKSLAAEELIRRNIRTPIFNDEQIKHAQTFVESDD